MNNSRFYYVFLFISLLLLQVFILNNILLFGYVNPYIYIAFVFLYPIKESRFDFLTLAFLLGLCVDFFTDTGGINAFATLSIAYIRPYFFKQVFQKSPNEHELFNLKQETFSKVFNYTAVLTIIHHFILFSLINFSFHNFLNVITNTLLSSIFTLLLYFLGSFIFNKNQ